MTRLHAGLLALALTSCSWFGSQATDAPDERDEHDEHAVRVVTLSPAALAAARIRVEPAVPGTLARELDLPARLVLDPRKEAAVSAWIGGQVGSIAVRTGDVVRKGQRLADVQSPELGEAIGAYRGAKARDEAADARLKRLTGLVEAGVSSRAQLLEAEASHAEALGALEAAEERLRILGVDPSAGDPHAGEHYPSHIPVRSPIAGKVLKTDVSVGQRVEPGASLFHIGALDALWLQLDVYERDLASVHAGQAVSFRVDAWPDERFEGTVDQVGDWVEPRARTVEVRVLVANEARRLKPNMFATATLTLSAEAQESGIVVPSTAVRDLDGEQVAFVQTASGRFEARVVVVARSANGRSLIREGLASGDAVVVDGAFALHSELEKGELGDGHGH